MCSLSMILFFICSPRSWCGCDCTWDLCSVCDTPSIYHPSIHRINLSTKNIYTMVVYCWCSILMYAMLALSPSDKCSFSSVNPFVFRCIERIQCGHLVIHLYQPWHTVGWCVRPTMICAQRFHRVNLCELCDLVGII